MNKKSKTIDRCQISGAKDLKTILSPKIPLIGNSQFIKKILKKIEYLSNSNARLLISGDYGSGKKLISKIVHAASKYKDKLPININFKNLSIQNIENLLNDDLSNLNDLPDGIFVQSLADSIISNPNEEGIKEFYPVALTKINESAKSVKKKLQEQGAQTTDIMAELM